MNAIAKLRISSKLSQSDLAVKVGVTQGAVSQWESGETYPSVDKLLSLAKIFNCTLDDLFKEDKLVNMRHLNYTTEVRWNECRKSTEKSIKLPVRVRDIHKKKQPS